MMLALVALEGCMYTRSNLELRKSGYSNYPTSVEAEYERRKKRRRRALIAAPIEIVAGVALTSLALYAPVKPSESETTTGVLKDAGKELLGRFLLASLGAGIAISGVGDGVLGAVDPAFGSPIVRRGKLVAAKEIDLIDPAPGPRFTFHAASVLGSDRIGSEMGFGLAHWVTPNVRFRYALGAEGTMPWSSLDRRLLGFAELALDRASSRFHAGLFPRTAFGIYIGGGWAAIEDREDRPALRGGLQLTANGYSYRLGTTFLPNERRPSIDFAMRMELRVD